MEPSTHPLHRLHDGTFQGRSYPAVRGVHGHLTAIGNIFISFFFFHMDAIFLARLTLPPSHLSTINLLPVVHAVLRRRRSWSTRGESWPTTSRMPRTTGSARPSLRCARPTTEARLDGSCRGLTKTAENRCDARSHREKNTG